MKQALPPLVPDRLGPTRDYLRDAALILGALQRAFTPAHPRDWQHGLEVGLRGLVTQPFKVDGRSVQASLDLVTGKVRLDGQKWLLEEYDGPEILKNFKAWILAQGVIAQLDEPEFSAGARHFDPDQSELYAHALWWYNEQFIKVKTSLSGGVTSPILVYPHHFDLSLVWYSHDDERQLGLGWSTGDDTIPEPYLYITAYPEPNGFTHLPLAKPAYWQAKGFSGAILLHKDLAASSDPTKLFADYAQLFQSAAPLLD